ncbi:MAG: hypothetical protein U0L19_09235 [Bacteroidales bacterium]|nr:hypothetical protein [Bacteroidales bacterium]
MTTRGVCGAMSNGAITKPSIPLNSSTEYSNIGSPDWRTSMKESEYGNL